MFEKITSGDKNFEIRLDDFNIEPGDIMELIEWDPITNNPTGRKMNKTARFVLKTKELPYWQQEKIDKYGYQVIGF